jgi:hypothetical protein
MAGLFSSCEKKRIRDVNWTFLNGNKAFSLFILQLKIPNTACSDMINGPRGLTRIIFINV